MIFGDSMIVIWQVWVAYYHSKVTFSSIEVMVLLQLQQFVNVKITHVLRNLNSLAYMLQTKEQACHK